MKCDFNATTQAMTFGSIKFDKDSAAGVKTVLQKYFNASKKNYTTYQEIQANQSNNFADIIFSCKKGKLLANVAYNEHLTNVYHKGLFESFPKFLIRLNNIAFNKYSEWTIKDRDKTSLFNDLLDKTPEV